MASGRGISIWRESGFGGKFKSQIGQVPELNIVPIQHVPLEKDGRAVRVVLSTMIEACNFQKLHQ